MFKTVEGLVYYATINLKLSKYDTDYVKNLIYRDLNILDIKNVKIDKKSIKEMKLPDIFLDSILEYAITNNIIEKEESDMLLTKIMGYLTPSPSLVNKEFKKIKDPIKKVDYLYKLGEKTNYIKTTAINKNIKWETKHAPKLTITINLSKPEKDNKEIAKLLTMTKSDYPKCMLCKENLGYPGRINYPARQTLRFTPMKLNKENWYLQFSPYAYYNQHCIAFNEKHVPMIVNKETVLKLFDFIDLYPHYFIGSNASLPIVGGSILNHEHFQGGLEKMPMMYSNTKQDFSIKGYDDVLVSEVDWYARSIRLQSSNRSSIEKLFDTILSKWLEYSNEEIDVLCYTNKPHNTLAPIAYFKDGKYILDIILRNNRCNDVHPDGIFHAHKEYHNIKKEGIGLIEATGIFILPPRLIKEIEEISNYLLTNIEVDNTFIHKDLVSTIKDKHSNINESNVEDLIKDEINDVCRNILLNISVFKDCTEGDKAFVNFMNSLSE